MKEKIIVCAVCAATLMSALAGVDLAAAEATAAAAIGTPSFPHAERATNTAIRLMWGKVPGADGYVVYKYDKKAKKFAAERVLPAGRKSWVDKGEPTGKLQRYKIAAYTTVGGKRVEGKPTYQVSALPYRKNDKVVNAGAIKAVDTEGPIGQRFMQVASSFSISRGGVGYAELYVEPSAWGRAEDKRVVDGRVMAKLLSGKDVIDIAMDRPRGLAVGVWPKKRGEAKVLLIAHNGNHKTVTVRVKDYAHPVFELWRLDQSSLQYELLSGWAQQVGDITQYCLDTGCSDVITLDDETGDVKAVSGADPVLVAMCEQLLDDFPYPMKITLSGVWGVDFELWGDPDRATGSKTVRYMVTNFPGVDDNRYIELAPYWYTWP